MYGLFLKVIMKCYHSDLWKHDRSVDSLNLWRIYF
jgi:hypothetical protein